MQAKSELIPISSEAKPMSYNGDHSPSKAHDGNYNTFYSVKDGETPANYLKLFLDGVFSISTVDVTNRLDGHTDRFAGTKVIVVTLGQLLEVGRKFVLGVGDCGTLAGNNLLVL